jgi:hypothetical protein
MMQSMHSHPFFRNHSGCNPQPESTGMFQNRMHGNAAMRLISMKIDTDDGNRDMAKHRAQQEGLPEGERDHVRNNESREFFRRGEG